MSGLPQPDALRERYDRLRALRTLDIGAEILEKVLGQAMATVDPQKLPIEVLSKFNATRDHVRELRVAVTRADQTIRRRGFAQDVSDVSQ